MSSNRLDVAQTSRDPPEKDTFEPEVQALVQHMVDRGAYSILPRIDSNGISYPEMGMVFPNKTPSEIKELLVRLVWDGILTSRLLDKVITCPACGGAAINSKYNCPRCTTFDIGKVSIIEHVRCGYIGSLEKFQKGEQNICPKCKGIVNDLEYKKIGTSFECNSCASRFEAPRVSHKCSTCEDVFSFKEAKYEPVFEYSLSDKTKRSATSGRIPLSSIAAVLKENGFDVGVKAELVGKSGATHTFDIIARKNSQLVVANFTFEPKEEDIIGLFAKKYDVDPTYTLLIALSPPSKEEEAVSKAYGVKIIYSTGILPIAEQIVKLAKNTANDA